MFRRFAATHEKDTCLWCGRKLRQKYHTEKEATGEFRKPTSCYNCAGYDGSKPSRFVATERPDYYQCANCGTDQAAERKRRVVSRTKVFAKPGDYGDGFFCGLRCAYDFAVTIAAHGRRLQRKRQRGRHAGT